MTTRRISTQERGTRLAIGGAVILAWPLILMITSGGDGNTAMLLIALVGAVFLAVGLLLRFR